LQAHYRSTLDFSNEALLAAEKGYKRLMEAAKTLKKLIPSVESSANIEMLEKDCYSAMNDDFNTPMVIASLFEGVRIINSVNDGKETLTANDIEKLKQLFDVFVVEILGLVEEGSQGNDQLINGLMETILTLRHEAKARKDWPTSDKIRDGLKELGIQVKDTKDGATWSLE
jgi:cysteinyl-tRNA synthetase